MRYILGVVALLEARDVNNSGRHLGFYQELEIRLKLQKRYFFVLCMILATRFTFIVERSWKQMYFHPKLACPPASYDFISRNHSDWPSLNLSQNVCEVWMNMQLLKTSGTFFFYRLLKNWEKPYLGRGGGGSSSTPSVRPRVSFERLFTGTQKKGRWNS